MNRAAKTLTALLIAATLLAFTTQTVTPVTPQREAITQTA